MRPLVRLSVRPLWIRENRNSRLFLARRWRDIIPNQTIGARVLRGSFDLLFQRVVCLSVHPPLLLCIIYIHSYAVTLLGRIIVRLGLFSSHQRFRITISLTEQYQIISETMEDSQYLVAESDGLDDSQRDDGNESDEGIDQIRDQDR